jgi:hypothetical protein
VLKTAEKIRARVTLAPYRTFREVEQPRSEFLFRLRNKAPDNLPECALFEADGGRWKLDAMLTIKEWLKDRKPILEVIA